MYLDLGPSRTLAPFNLITLSSSPFLATIGGGDFKRATTRRFGNLEGLVAGIEYLFDLYRNDSELVSTARRDCRRHLPCLLCHHAGPGAGRSCGRWIWAIMAVAGPSSLDR